MIYVRVCRLDYATPPRSLLQMFHSTCKATVLCLISLAVCLKVLSLLEIILDGTPHLAGNLKLCRKVSVVISPTNSRCTAHVVQQVYKLIHVFEDPLPDVPHT